MELNSILILIGVFIVAMGVSLALYFSYKNNYFKFVNRYHWTGLALFLFAGMFTSLAMIFMVNSDFNVKKRQWLAFGFSLVISILFWFRFLFSIESSAPEEEISV